MVVHLIGLLLPELKIEKADCPINERVYWQGLFQKLSVSNGNIVL